MSEIEQEVPLHGGNVTGAVRVGQTVRRAIGPWSASVHALLLHLEHCKFNGSPRFLGLDEQGREILTFIEGEIGHYPLQPYMWSDASLVAVAQLLRRYHDATSSFIPPENAIWHFAYPDHQQHEVICHGDVAPYNLIYRAGRPYVLIDFDTAGPGPRLWDLAYAAYCFVPLSYAVDKQEIGLAAPSFQGPRLRLFCQAYQLEPPYTAVLDFVERRLYAMCEWLSEGAAAHDPARLRLVNEGHLAHYQREIVAFQRHRPSLEPHLTHPT